MSAESEFLKLLPTGMAILGHELMGVMVLAEVIKRAAQGTMSQSELEEAAVAAEGMVIAFSKAKGQIL